MQAKCSLKFRAMILANVCVNFLCQAEAKIVKAECFFFEQGTQGLAIKLLGFVQLRTVRNVTMLQTRQFNVS